MTLSVDEFTLTEQALWFVMESHAELAQHVQIGNRIRYSGADESPGKDSTLSADKPELEMIPATGAANNKNTSSSVGFAMNYTIGLRTATKSTAKPKGLNAITCMIYRAFEAWGDKLPACPWAKIVRLSQFQATPGEKSEPDDREGWIGVLSVTVEMVFERGLMEVAAWQ